MLTPLGAYVSGPTGLCLEPQRTWVCACVGTMCMHVHPPWDTRWRPLGPEKWAPRGVNMRYPYFEC